MRTLLLFLGGILLIAPSANAQLVSPDDDTPLSFTEPRVLFHGSDEVKVGDGERELRTTTLTYDPVAGIYEEIVENADGQIIRRETMANVMVGPLPEEDAFAKQFIREDQELSALIEASPHEVVVNGGFELVREEGHPCGPGSRCLQYDVMEIIPGQRAAERIRYVVVDLRDGTFVSRDFDPSTEGNLAHPGARSSYD